MVITREEIKKVADLARLSLTEQEETRHAETISAVLEYMTILNEVDTTGVEITAQVTGLENVTREDVVIPSVNAARLLKRMPQVQNNELVVPGVFE